MSDNLKTLNEYLGNYMYVILVGILGSLLNIGAREDKSTKRKCLDLVMGILSSTFFGWISYEIILFIWNSEKVALAGCGFFSWKGAVWFGSIIDKIIDAKIKGMINESNYNEDKKY